MRFYELEYLQKSKRNTGRVFFCVLSMTVLQFIILIIAFIIWTVIMNFSAEPDFTERGLQRYVTLCNKLLKPFKFRERRNISEYLEHSIAVDGGC